MKAVISILVVCLLFLSRSNGFAQEKFKGTKYSLSEEESKLVSKKLKKYKPFEIDLKSLETHIKKEKESKKQLIQFDLEVEGETFNFTLVENDVLTKDFVLFENDRAVSLPKEAVHTYAGYVANHPKYALRLYISEKRFSGIFRTADGEYTLQPISDYGVKEPAQSSTIIRHILARVEDEIPSNENMVCGNKAVFGTVKPPRSANARVAFSSCKFVRLAIATDDEYYSVQNYSSASDVAAKMQEMVNNMEFVLLNNNQNTYGIAPVGLRLQLAALKVYNQNDPFNAQGTGNAVLEEFTNLVNNGTVFPTWITKNVSHLLTGRPMGNTGGVQFGQANPGRVCSDPAYATSCNTIKNFATSDIISYQNAWTVMLHEISHVLGATSDLGLTGFPDYCTDDLRSIMCQGLSKKLYFNQLSIDELDTYLNANGSCLYDNNALPAYSNNFTLFLNNNKINSTPVFINQYTKTLSIPNDPNTPLNASSFVPSDGRVNRFNTSLYSTQFMIGAAPNFTMTVSAYNQCGYSIWGVPFVYSSAGARVAVNTYPIPAADAVTIEQLPDEKSGDGQSPQEILLYDEKGNLLKRVLPFNKRYETILLNELKTGTYYFHIVYPDGVIEKKRILKR